MTDPEAKGLVVGAEAGTINHVLDQLDAILAWSRATSSRLGYFTALYRKVTLEVKDGIGQGVFDDGDRMERLDVVFANRYLSAVAAYRQRRPTPDAWMAAFTAAGRWWPIVLQHLLLGINAHINLDLGVAAARTVTARELPRLRGDFYRLNAILAGLVGEVQGELGQIWPTFRLFNRYLGRTQTAIINFSIEKARDRAWSVAEQLAPLAPADQNRAIERLDYDVATFARVISNPGVILGAVTRIVRLGETGSVQRKVDILV